MTSTLTLFGVTLLVAAAEASRIPITPPHPRLAVSSNVANSPRRVLPRQYSYTLGFWFPGGVIGFALTVVGLTALAIAIGISIWLCCRERKRKRQEHQGPRYFEIEERLIEEGPETASAPKLSPFPSSEPPIPMAVLSTPRGDDIEELSPGNQAPAPLSRYTSSTGTDAKASFEYDSFYAGSSKKALTEDMSREHSPGPSSSGSPMAMPTPMPVPSPTSYPGPHGFGGGQVDDPPPMYDTAWIPPSAQPRHS